MKISFEEMYSKTYYELYQTDMAKGVFLKYLGDGKDILDILKDNRFPTVGRRNSDLAKIWLCTHFLSDKTNRLFAVGCCRLIWNLIDESYINALIVTKKLLLGDSSTQELQAAKAEAEEQKNNSDNIICEVIRDATWGEVNESKDRAWFVSNNIANLRKSYAPDIEELKSDMETSIQAIWKMDLEKEVREEVLEEEEEKWEENIRNVRNKEWQDAWKAQVEILIKNIEEYGF